MCIRDRTEPAVSTVAEAVSEELEFHPDHKAVLTAPEPEEATADAAGQETQSEQETASALFEEEKPGEETSWEADGFMEEAMAQAAQTEEEDMTIFVIGTDGRDQEIRVSKSAMAEELRNLEESYLEEEVLGEPQPEYQEDRALEEKIGAPQGESPLFGEPETGWESIAEETVSVPKERPWRYEPTPVREAHVAPPELSGMEAVSYTHLDVYNRQVLPGPDGMARGYPAAAPLCVFVCGWGGRIPILSSSGGFGGGSDAVFGSVAGGDLRLGGSGLLRGWLSFVMDVAEKGVGAPLPGPLKMDGDR